MSFDLALRASEILLALAFIQSSAEHVFGTRDAPLLFAVRGVLAVLVLFNIAVPWALIGLCLHSVVALHRYQGPYNGGSDRMGLLVLYCVTLAHVLPAGLISETAFGYLGIQVVMSYFISGKVKIVNPDWRSGRALADVFAFSAYPVSERLRDLANRPRQMMLASWPVIGFELVFPISLLWAPALVLALTIAFAFHLANACLFGLNRFVWVWVASYPSLLWIQGRIGLF